MIRLLIKIHNTTGLKYLCKTERDDWENYSGSGMFWKRHIIKYGKNISTVLVFETEDKNEFKIKALEISELYKVSSNNSWANLIPESGAGGDTVSNRKWINNGIEEKYTSTTSIPNGWVYGRLSTCVFRQPDKQKEFNKRVNRNSKQYHTSRKIATQKMLAVRDHSKCGKKGDDNVSKRSDVREKISNAMKKPITIRGLYFDSKSSAAKYFNVSITTITNWYNNERYNNT